MEPSPFVLDAPREDPDPAPARPRDSRSLGGVGHQADGPSDEGFRTPLASSVAPVAVPSSRRSAPASEAADATGLSGAGASPSVGPSAPTTATESATVRTNLVPPRSGVWGGGRGTFLAYGGAFAVGLGLVGVQLWLWQRHQARAEFTPIEASGESTAEGSEGLRAAVAAGAVAPPAAPEAFARPSPPPVRLSEGKVVSCHDPGPRRTPPERCDRLPALETALVNAITTTSACSGTTLGGAVYVLDASFLRKRSPYYMQVASASGVPGTPGRGAGGGLGGSSPAALAAARSCAAEIKRALLETPLPPIPHEHARYKLSVRATYAAAAPRAPALTALSQGLSAQGASGQGAVAAPALAAQSPAPGVLTGPVVTAAPSPAAVSGPAAVGVLPSVRSTAGAGDPFGRGAWGAAAAPPPNAPSADDRWPK
jgi:hypothetical protein